LRAVCHSGIRMPLEGREHVGDGEVFHLADTPRKCQGMDRPHLHIPREPAGRFLSGLPVEDQVEDLSIRMGRGDHSKGGGLPGPRPRVDQQDPPCRIQYGLLFFGRFHETVSVSQRFVSLCIPERGFLRYPERMWGARRVFFCPKAKNVLFFCFGAKLSSCSYPVIFKRSSNRTLPRKWSF